ncbi:MAG: protein-L-isoaspartate O-methyltransferase [Halobacteriaceae archaeon]
MDPEALRDAMVSSLEHETSGAVRSADVAAAMRAVPRHEFVEVGPDRAYLDRDFTHLGSRVVAPSTTARLVEAVDAGDGHSVLVVGAGVGYTAAVLAEVVGARNVHAVDITRALVSEARRNLGDAGYRDVLVDCADGAEGLAHYAPFDRILVEAAAVRPPAALREQLAPGGRLVLPLGRADQTLAAVEPDAADADDRGVVAEFGPVAFDPLLVEGEQYGAVERNRSAREERERSARAARSRSGWEQEWIDWDDR